MSRLLAAILLLAPLDARALETTPVETTPATTAPARPETGRPEDKSAPAATPEVKKTTPPLDERRLLLCQPRVLGDAKQARAPAVIQAANVYSDRIAKYWYCADGQDAAAAARHLGLRFALNPVAEGSAEGSRYLLSLTEAVTGRGVLELEVRVKPNEDPVRPLENALGKTVTQFVPTPIEKWGPWVVAGTGVAVLLVGAVFALQAQSALNDANAATTQSAAAAATARFHRRQTASVLAFGVGGAAVATGLVWRWAF